MWTPYQTVFVRSPVKRPEQFLAWSAKGPQDASAPAYKARLSEELLATFSNGYCRTALLTASPSLHARLQQHQKNQHHDKRAELIPQLASYWSRMCFRPTPFGLFAGVSAVPLSSVDQQYQTEPTFQARLDLAAASAISARALATPAIRQSLRYRCNDTARVLAHTIAYVEPYRQGSTLQYRRSQVDRTSHIEHVLKATSQWLPYRDLVTLLIQFDDALTQADIFEFLDELIAAELLISELAFSANQESPTIQLQSALPQQLDDPLIVLVQQLSGLLDSEQITTAPEIESLSTQVSSLLSEQAIPVGRGGPLQVDTGLQQNHHALDEALLDSVSRDFARLSRVFSAQANTLSAFRDAFVAKFGTAEIALLEALDEDNGIPIQVSHYETPLLTDLSFRQQSTPAQAFDQVELWLLKKLLGPDSLGHQEIELTDRDLDGLSGSDHPTELPDLYCLMLTAWAATESATASGCESRLAVLEGFSPGLNLIGRFCHLNTNIRDAATALAKQESARSDAILAEINYLPPDRVGNVALRPKLYNYEIPIFACESRPENEVIRLDDLLLCARDNRLVLRSRKLNREILPRLPNAHNFTASSMPVYRFLAQLQFENKHFFRFGWGKLESLITATPQVRYNRTILTRRRWRVTEEQLAIQAKATRETKLDAACQLSMALDLPRFVSIVRGDQLLMLDLENPIYQELLVDELLADKQVLLEDGGTLIDGEWVGPTDASRNSELVVPYVRENSRDVNQASYQSAAHSVNDKAIEKKLPGGEWVYAKLYAKPHLIDQLVHQHLPAFVSDHCQGLTWFFIRYRDSEWHLRLRVRVEDRDQHIVVLNQMQQWARQLHENGCIQGVQFDTYEREVTRYGGPLALSRCEEYFGADSQFALDVSEQISASEQDRWLAVLVSVSSILTDFGLDLAQQFELISDLREGYGKEFSETAALRKELGQKYLKVRTQIESAVQHCCWQQGSAKIDIASAIARRRHATTPIVTELKRLNAEKRLSRELKQVIESLIHMTTNRLLLIHFREHELVIYDFLRRYLLAEQKRHSTKVDIVEATAV